MDFVEIVIPAWVVAAAFAVLLVAAVAMIRQRRR